MGKKLVIVESPAKAKTINKILGGDFLVKSSVGHVRDLPVSGLGVDIENGFKPKYVAMKGKKKVIDELVKAAKAADSVYLAPDPDREGEAIAWHLRELLKKDVEADKFFRVQYNEITPGAVRKAFENPGQLDMNRVDAQQARRVLDRLVGYIVSPMLWRQLRRGLSAGRVQSVALRLLCEREAEILGFTPEEYWIIGAMARKLVPPQDPFRLQLIRIDNEKAHVRTAQHAQEVKDDLAGRSLRVQAVVVKQISKRPAPPYITSTMQQAGSSYCSYAPKRTMDIAQRLYEGVDLGEGPVGLITYMRTDSVNVSADAQNACREMIRRQFGEEYCPEKPNVYKSRGGAQEAHEAIRPTDVERTPESLSGILKPDEMNLYRLIWQRFVASQMTPAVIEQRTAKVESLPPEGRTHVYLFTATASHVTFPGYMRASGVDLKKPKGESQEEGETEALPPLAEGERLECLDWLTERRETKPPPRYSEATLIRDLESNGVGRPSTYAQILSTLQTRRYVLAEKRTLVPTELGLSVNALLVASLEELFNVKFTAAMEGKLDQVESGAVVWTDMLAEFYKQFDGWMQKVRVPPADTAVVTHALELLANVHEWTPEVKRGKRIYGDERFVKSVRTQAEKAERPISQRQLDALLRIAVRYASQVPGIEAYLQESGRGELLAQAAADAVDESSTALLSALEPLQLDESAREFLSSLKARVDGGRSLTEPQKGALRRMAASHAGEIPNFLELKEKLGIPEALLAPDEESAPLLGAMADVKTWNEPVTRGRRVFDDKLFYESLSQQFARKKSLSDKQRAALKSMLARYKEQVKDFANLAETYGIGKKRK